MNIVDLHVHSNKSDGSMTPAALVNYAVKKGLSAFALTDHDTTAGIRDAMDAAKQLCPDTPLTVIPGIELSTQYDGRDIHILGLFIQWESPSFQEKICDFMDSRVIRNRQMCRNLQDAGIDISYDRLLSEFPGSVITRGHYARYLLTYGYVKSMPEAFERYVGDHTKYFVPRTKVTPIQAVDLIRQAGGLSILAHPPLYHMSDRKLETLVSALAQAGMSGIEAVYSTYSASDERNMRRLAAQYHLGISGGSDFHGSTKPKLDLATGYGSLFIPEEILDKLKQRLPKILFTDLDGTLLTSDKKITPYTKDVLEQFIKQGNKLALSSGRAMESMQTVKDTAGLDFSDVYLIGSNGGEIKDCRTGDILHRASIPLPLVSLVMNKAEEMGIHCHTYTDTNIISPHDTEALRHYCRTIHTPVLLCEDVLSALDQEPCKCIAIEIHDKDKLEQFRLALEPLVKDRLSLLYSNDQYLEIFPISSGKGTAVKKLCNILNIDPSRSYAAGDEDNDISMLEAAECGIAMYNAKPEVKQIADLITAEDNNHDGLAKLLAELIKI